MDPQNVSSPTAVNEESVVKGASSDKRLKVIIFLLIGVTSVLLVMLASMFMLFMARTASTVIEDENIVERLDGNSESSPEVNVNDPQNDTAENVNMVFENQKVFESSGMRIVFPADWTIKEDYGMDGGALVVTSPWVDNPWGDDPNNVRSTFGLQFGLGVPVDPTGNFDCNRGDVVSSVVSKTVYRKILNNSSADGNQFVICESNDGGKTFSLPLTGDAFVITSSTDGYFMNELDTILKNIVRK